MGNEMRTVWTGVGVVLALAALGLIAVAVLAFGRVPDAPPGETKDLALGLMSVLLVLVFGVMSWACIATGKRAADASSHTASTLTDEDFLP